MNVTFQRTSDLCVLSCIGSWDSIMQGNSSMWNWIWKAVQCEVLAFCILQETLCYSFDLFFFFHLQMPWPSARTIFLIYRAQHAKKIWDSVFKKLFIISRQPRQTIPASAKPLCWGLCACWGHRAVRLHLGLLSTKWIKGQLWGNQWFSMWRLAVLFIRFGSV